MALSICLSFHGHPTCFLAISQKVLQLSVCNLVYRLPIGPLQWLFWSHDVIFKVTAAGFPPALETEIITKLHSALEESSDLILSPTRALENVLSCKNSVYICVRSAPWSYGHHDNETVMTFCSGISTFMPKSETLLRSQRSNLVSGS